MFQRTTDNMRTLRVDLISGITFNDFEAELLHLGITNLLLNTTINNTITNLNTFEILSGTSINTVDTHLNSFKILSGTSWSNQLSTNQFIQNQIDSLVLVSVSESILDYLYGISIAVLDSKIGNQLGITNTYFNNSLNSLGVSESVIDSKFGLMLGSTLNPLGISEYNLEIHKQDRLQCSTSFAEIQLDVNNININLDTLFTDISNISTTFTNNKSLLGTSLTVIENDITTLFTTMNTDVTALGTSLSNTTSKLQTAIEIVSGALSAFDAAQTIYNIANTLTNATQDSELLRIRPNIRFK